MGTSLSCDGISVVSFCVSYLHYQLKSLLRRKVELMVGDMTTHGCTLIHSMRLIRIKALPQRIVEFVNFLVLIVTGQRGQPV